VQGNDDGAVSGGSGPPNMAFVVTNSSQDVDHVMLKLGQGVNAVDEIEGQPVKVQRFIHFPSSHDVPPTPTHPVIDPYPPIQVSTGPDSSIGLHNLFGTSPEGCGGLLAAPGTVGTSKIATMTSGDACSEDDDDDEDVVLQMIRSMRE